MVLRIKGLRRIKKTDLVLAIFIIAMIIRAFTARYESTGLISQLKYGVCLIGIFYCWIVMGNNKQPRIFKRELKDIWIMIGIFALLSIFYMVLNVGFTTRTILELVFLTLPITYAFLLVNVLEWDQVYQGMCITLIIFIIGYIIDLGMSIGVIISNLSSISFADSYSMLESSTFAGPSITLACFFLYYRKNKIISITSVIFVLMTFKRLSVVFVLLLVVLPYFIDLNKSVNRTVLQITKFAFGVLTITYFYIMIPANVQYIATEFGIDLYKFTMSRTYRFSLLYNNPNFLTTGLGSSYIYLISRYGVSLEMDLLRILFEVGVIGLLAIINQMFNIVKKNRYCFVVMIYLFLNLLFSHSLVDVFGWLLLYIIFACIQYKHTESIGITWKTR